MKKFIATSIIMAIVMSTVAGMAVSRVQSQGRFAIEDAVNILKYVVGLTDLTESQQNEYNLDSSPSVGIGDAVEILKYVVGLPSVIEPNPPTQQTQTTSPPRTTQPPQTTSHPQTTSAMPESTIVWLSATGSSWHSINNCGRMNPARAIQITLGEARERANLSACANCNAPK